MVTVKEYIMILKEAWKSNVQTQKETLSCLIMLID